MDAEEFRRAGKEMVDYICDYMQTVGTRKVTPGVKPGYLKRLIPREAPEAPEAWDNIMSDVETKIMQGVTHWQHPHFHAYFPSGNSYPSILGDMLSDGIGVIGFSWVASPACQELEQIVMDWFGQAIGLPDKFLNDAEGSKGGGVIQGSASDCILTTMLAARAEALRRLREEEVAKKGDEQQDEEEDEGPEDGHLLPRLIAYCSQEAHACVEKAAKICLVKLRILEPEDGHSLSAGQLSKAMEEDADDGLCPFFFSATFGSTGTCSFDPLAALGPVCRRFGAWMHVDGAYAGNAMICPEFKPLFDGIEYANSFNTNPNKWLLTNFDCSTLWVDDRFKFTRAMVVDPLYLQHSHDSEVIDYRHWGIPLSRRFRALKLWFVMRSYGLEGLRAYIRNHCKLAKRFEALVREDPRFEVCNEVKMGLVCFRLKGADKLNQDLLDTINDSGKLFIIPAKSKGRYILRFCVVAETATDNDIDHAWSVISSITQEFLEARGVVVSKGVLRRAESIAAQPASPSSPGKPPILRRLTRQFSFTRSVSRDMFRRSASRTSLYDGVSPMVVLDEDGQQDEQDVFDFGAAVNGHACTIPEETTAQ
nr:tyrosine decarboxylase 2 [Ischnura senegalensis]